MISIMLQNAFDLCHEVLQSTFFFEGAVRVANDPDGSLAAASKTGLSFRFHHGPSSFCHPNYALINTM